MKIDNFNLDDQWRLYLKRVYLNESNMSRIQIKETKQAFMYGISIMLLDIMPMVSDYSEDEGIDILDRIKLQIENYFELLNKDNE